MTLSATEQTHLNEAINLMVLGQAREEPFADDVIERLAPAAASTGFMDKGEFYAAVRDNPVSTLLRWVLYVGTN